MPGAGHSNAGRLGTNVVATPDMAFLPKRSLVRPLVQDGVVVTPVRIRNVPISSSSLTQGMTTRTMPVQEIVLAVDPEEVAPLAEAMDLKYEITCVARSGRPAAPAAASQAAAGGVSRSLPPLPRPSGHDGAAAPDKAASSPKSENRQHPKSETPAKDQAAMDITPGLDPMAQIRFMEVMIGTQRQFMLFTGPGNSPVVASQDDGSAKAASRGKRASNRRVMKLHRGKAADRAGYALVLFVMIFFGLMGLAALVIDMGFARLAQRQMQTAVDSAALEGLRWRDVPPIDQDPPAAGEAKWLPACSTRLDLGQRRNGAVTGPGRWCNFKAASDAPYGFPTTDRAGHAGLSAERVGRALRDWN